ncbi:MAG: hypothetical protein ACK52H_12225 [Burkholderiales bacterium]|jgi:hypothetical protein|uniref:hypothetical protein n=1 Tax=Limnohabitans sp. TaxID=1907725 RepID=UPI0025F6237F|nr:hypothetical protein [Limnohabitans sp.]
MATLLTWLLHLFMALLGLVFLLGLWAALGLYLVWATLRWVLTGRKPQVLMIWQQLNTMRQTFRQGSFRRPAPGPAPAWRTQPTDEQVVDVQARELDDKPTRLPPP